MYNYNYITNNYNCITNNYNCITNNYYTGHTSTKCTTHIHLYTQEGLFINAAYSLLTFIMINVLLLTCTDTFITTISIQTYHLNGTLGILCPPPPSSLLLLPPPSTDNYTHALTATSPHTSIITLSPYHTITLSPYHTITLYYHPITLSHYTVTLSPITLSHTLQYGCSYINTSCPRPHSHNTKGHTITLSPYHSITLSPYHTITLKATPTSSSTKFSTTPNAGISWDFSVSLACTKSSPVKYSAIIISSTWFLARKWPKEVRTELIYQVCSKQSPCI